MLYPKVTELYCQSSYQITLLLILLLLRRMKDQRVLMPTSYVATFWSYVVHCLAIDFEILLSLEEEEVFVKALR